MNSRPASNLTKAFGINPKCVALSNNVPTVDCSFVTPRCI